MEHLTFEMRMLLYATALLLVLWIPYILAELATHGVVKALSYRTDRALPGWAARLKEAHYNAVENYAPFAVVVFAAEFYGIHTELTATCAMVYLVARAIHPFAQMSRVWGTRTVTFAAGWGATAVYLYAVLCGG